VFLIPDGDKGGTLSEDSAGSQWIEGYRKSLDDDRQGSGIQEASRASRRKIQDFRAADNHR
jgi:hypothetical protein